MRWFLGILATIVAVGLPDGQQCAAGPAVRDIQYARIDGHSLKLDLYLPESGNDQQQMFPVIVWVHGGAWRSGSKDQVPIQELVKCGFAIASVDYRLSTQARFPAQIHDIRAAVRFLKARAAKYQLDPGRFVLAGASAGGHLAALAGVSNRVDELEGTVGEHLDQDSSVAAIISFYGASDLQTILSESTAHGLAVRVPALQLLLGGQPDEKPELARLASPVAHVDPHDPPLWLIHGDADPQMPPQQSEKLAKIYRSHGLAVSLEIIPGGRHGGTEFYEPERLQTLADQIRAQLN